MNTVMLISILHKINQSFHSIAYGLFEVPHIKKQRAESLLHYWQKRVQQFKETLDNITGKIHLAADKSSRNWPTTWKGDITPQSGDNCGMSDNPTSWKQDEKDKWTLFLVTRTLKSFIKIHFITLPLL